MSMMNVTRATTKSPRKKYKIELVSDDPVSQVERGTLDGKAYEKITLTGDKKTLKKLRKAIKMVLAEDTQPGHGVSITTSAWMGE